MFAIGRAMAGLGLSLLFIPLASAAEAEQNKDLQDQAALAEKQVAIKRASVKVAEAQKVIARSSRPRAMSRSSAPVVFSTV